MPKDKIFSFKIEEKAKAEFEMLCKEKHSTPSHELYAFVHQKIKQHKGIRKLNKR